MLSGWMLKHYSSSLKVLLETKTSPVINPEIQERSKRIGYIRMRSFSKG